MLPTATQAPVITCSDLMVPSNGMISYNGGSTNSRPVGAVSTTRFSRLGMATEDKSRVDELLKQAHSLPVDKQRRIAAILGAVVADAAAQPLHWVYDPVTMRRAVADVEYPEFLPNSVNPFYDLPAGNQSPYGDECVMMLESLVASKGFNYDDAAERTFKAFGPGSPYDNEVSIDYSKGLKDIRCPMRQRWQNVLLRRFGDLYAAKKKLTDLPEEDENKDPDNIPRSVPLVAYYAGTPDFFTTVYDACSQLQNSDIMLTIVLAACRIIEQYIFQDASVSEGSPQVAKVIEDLKFPKRTFPNDLDLAVAGFLSEALAAKDMTVDEATIKLGKA